MGVGVMGDKIGESMDDLDDVLDHEDGDEGQYSKACFSYCCSL